MFSLFQIFKIILGIIISVFILFMLLRFSGSYTEIGEASKEATVLKNFEKASQDVYVTGVPSNFTFKMESEKAIFDYKPPYLRTTLGPLEFNYMLLFFEKGSEVFIDKKELDFNWWRFQWVEALPETRIVFIPLNDTDVVWDTMQKIVNNLPTTDRFGPNTGFDFGCNETKWTHSQKWNGKKFSTYIQIIRHFITRDRLCEQEIKNECPECKIVIISDNGGVVQVDKEILVVPNSNSTGYVYLNSSGVLDSYFYKNPLDIVALLLGGKDFYDYENKVFLERLNTMSNAKTNEITLLNLHPSTNPSCTGPYSDLISILNSVSEYSDLSKVDYGNEDNMTMLDQHLEESKIQYKYLESIGCE
jgi:hypothetical protein